MRDVVRRGVPSAPRQVHRHPTATLFRNAAHRQTQEGLSVRSSPSCCALCQLLLVARMHAVLGAARGGSRSARCLGAATSRRA